MVPEYITLEARQITAKAKTLKSLSFNNQYQNGIEATLSVFLICIMVDINGT